MNSIVIQLILSNSFVRNSHIIQLKFCSLQGKTRVSTALRLLSTLSSQIRRADTPFSIEPQSHILNVIHALQQLAGLHSSRFQGPIVQQD